MTPSPSMLLQLAEGLSAAERRQSDIQKYIDNLPADKEYDLGIELRLSWGSCYEPSGHSHCERFLRSAIKAKARDLMNNLLREAKAETEEARRALIEYAKGD